MKTPTFREQYEKIVGAYLRGELRPADSCACFIGNMLNGHDEWGTSAWCLKDVSSLWLAEQVGDWQEVIDQQSGGLYTHAEIETLEYNFLEIIYGQKIVTDIGGLWFVHVDESRLFLAMESTLLMLRQIHESKGEVIEDYTFTKRELQTV